MRFVSRHETTLAPPAATRPKRSGRHVARTAARAATSRAQAAGDLRTAAGQGTPRRWSRAGHAGTLRRRAARAVLHHIVEQVKFPGCSIDLLDLHSDPLELFHPETTYRAPHYAALKARVERADVFLLATPDYHGSVSSTLKNFLDHFWKEF